MTAPEFPEWFDWAEYDRLIALKDRSRWAWLFMVRDPDNNEAASRHAGWHWQMDSYGLDGIPRTNWRDGVLCFGMRGYQTHEYIDRVAGRFDHLAAIEPEPSRRPDTVSTSSAPGTSYLVFESQYDYEKHRKAQKEARAGVIELAINTNMPKAEILAEVERLIDEHRTRAIIEHEKLERQTRETWRKGLAAWDLRQAGWLTADIARWLQPLWRNKTPVGGRPSDPQRLEVRQAIAAVEPMILGGWRTLCGDPVGFFESPTVTLTNKIDLSRK